MKIEYEKIKIKEWKGESGKKYYMVFDQKTDSLLGNVYWDIEGGYIFVSNNDDCKFIPSHLGEIKDFIEELKQQKEGKK